MEIVLGLVVVLVAVAIMLAAKLGADRARREREERWARIPTGLAGAGTGAPIGGLGNVSRPSPAQTPDVASGRTGAGGPTAPSGPAAQRPPPAAARPQPAPGATAPGSARLAGRPAPAAASTPTAKRDAAPTPAGPQRLRRQAPPIDVNTAGVEELRTLPGVGVRAAERIVAHRERYGPFSSLAGLEAVERFDTQRVSRLAGRAKV